MRYVLSLTVSALLLIASPAMSQPIESGIELGVKAGFNLATMSGDLTGWQKTLHEYDWGSSDYSDNYGNSSRTLPRFGLFATFHVNEAFGVQTEFLYVKKGVKGSGEANITDGTMLEIAKITETVSLTYLEIPLLLKYKLPLQGSVQPAFFFGPALAIKASATNETEIDVTFQTPTGSASLQGAGEPDIDNTKSTDFGLVLGGDIGIKMGQVRLYLDARYTLGFSQQFEDVDPDDVPDIDIVDQWPDKFPMVNNETGKACQLKNRALSVMVGVAFQVR
jgi:hypothetical protein